jgi:NADPH:quinone reductase-like Zn-dependent oxidoreductase
MATKVVATAYGGPEVLSVVEADVPAPEAGQVVVDVRAAGVNPADHKIISGAMGADPARLPLPVGLEVAGVVSAVGPDAEGPGGALSVGDEVVAYPVEGGYADTVVAAAANTVPKPAALPWPEAAGALLTGGTAAHTVAAVGIKAGETLLVHGGAGSVGQLVVQLAVQAGATVVATAGERSHEQLRGFGAIPVTYGSGLIDRVRAVAPDGVDAAVDTVGTDEAVDTSLELVPDRSRIASIAAFGRADTGIVLLSKDDPETRVRAEVWRTLLPAVANGTVTVNIARTYPLADAAEALQFVRDGHAGGKVVLLP